MRNSPICLVVALALPVAPLSEADAARTWHVAGGVVTLALDSAHLESLGLTVSGVRTTASDPDDATRLPGEPRSFAVDPTAISFRTERGAFLGLVGGTRMTLPVQGGLAIGGRDPATGAALTPVFLYDFSLDVDFAREGDAVVLRSPDPAQPTPLDVKNAGVLFREDQRELGIFFADLQVSESWAVSLGQPRLAGQWIGSLELRLDASTTDPRDRSEAVGPDVPAGEDAAAPLDLLLAELYGITNLGRVGTYPNARNGLSAATTSCNAGGVNIPWNAPMAETHPFIGLALFRVKNGVLEQIGRNWIKHGFFALSNNQCGFGCTPSNGTYMGVGCSDTYSVSNNGSRFYLGPRREVNPYLGTWEACGSFFDEPVNPDPDCSRNYNGNEPNEVNHRLEVWDEDLGNPGATYYYEGVYYVADDQGPFNNIGWRQCTMTWGGTNWSFNTVGGGLGPNLGTVASTWGDQQTVQDVATGDGPVVLAVDVTDLGGGQWHYEYALYNWLSDRGVWSFSIPVGGASVTSVGFHDIDKDAGNDWTATVAGGFVTWETEDWATNENANFIEYQSLYNFRFDANVPPIAGQAQAGIFKPGVGTSFFANTQVPGGGAVGVGELAAAAPSLALRKIEPNPFRSSAKVAFSLPRRGPAKLSVFDVTGRTVRVLLDGDAPAGTREVVWDGRDGSGRQVASGVYLVRLETEDGARTTKVARLR